MALPPRPKRRSFRTMRSDEEQAFNVTWPATAPQFFGFVKVDVSWFAQDHLMRGL